MTCIFIAIILVGLSVLAEGKWMKTILAAAFLLLGIVTLTFGLH